MRKTRRSRAFDSFVRGATAGRFPRLDDRNDLWRLLVVITERKAIDQLQRERRRKRGGGKVVEFPGSGDGDDGPNLLRVAGGEPTPEFAASVAEECCRLLAGLRDDTLRTVALLRMEGHTNEEIARHLRCSLRTVARKVELIRGTWLCEMGTES